MSAQGITPTEATRICRIVCHTCDDELFTDGLPTREVAAWAGRHDHDVEVFFDDDMGLIPTPRVVA